MDNCKNEYPSKLDYMRMLHAPKSAYNPHEEDKDDKEEPDFDYDDEDEDDADERLEEFLENLAKGWINKQISK